MPEVAEKKGPLRVLGVYAHPDDETFCTGGTLAKYAAAGAEIMVVSATQGEAGQIRDALAATRRTLGQVRVSEMQQACHHLGVQHVVCLDYGDGKLSHLDPTVLVTKITEIIRIFQPDIVLTFGNDGVYGHPDHITIGAATDTAFGLASDAGAFPEHRVIGLRAHAPSRLYHSFFQRHRGFLLQRLVRWLQNLDARFCGTPDFVRGLLILAEATCTLGYSRDSVHVAWYPSGVYIIEQGEPSTSLYLILSGHADVVREEPDGRLNKVNEIGPGAFFGEEGIATQQPRNANIIARDSVSCMVLSPGEPTPYAGRGQNAQYCIHNDFAPPEPIAATTCIEVSDYVSQKVTAMASYRTQCPMTPDLLPEAILRDVFAHEYFVRIYPGIELETELYPVPL
jgi:LmbE family N-acetylglucosaminyl deacetylase